MAPTLEMKPNEAAAVKKQVRSLCRTDLHYLARHVLNYDRVTDHIHKQMAQDIDTPHYRFKLLLWPRGHFKSTIATEAGAIQRLLRDPNERILITNAKLDNSRKFLRAIANHFEANSKFRWFWRKWWIENFATAYDREDMGDRLDWVTQDTQDEFTLLRERGREASISTAGVGASMVSQHYSTIIADDLVNREYVSTAAMVEKSILHFKDLLDLLDTDGDLVVIGTRWSYMDLYGYMIDEFSHRAKLIVPEGYVSEEAMKRSKEKRNKDWLISIKPCYDDSGEPIFPEEYSRDVLEQLEHDKGSYEFGCFPPQTKVMTPMGREDIESVKVGDEVIDSEGSVRQVEYVNSDDCMGDLVKIKVRTQAEPIYATPNHPFLVQKATKYRCWLVQPDTTLITGSGAPVDPHERLPEPEWVRADEIDHLDTVFYPLPKYRSAVSGIWEDSDAWYLLGRWLAEGSCLATGVDICAGRHERGLIERDAGIVRGLLERKGRIIERSTTYVVAFSHPEFTPICHAAYLGRPGQKVLPGWMEFVDEKYLMALWEGYFSGDGFTDQRKGVNANSVSVPLLEQMQRMLWRLRKLPSINKLYDARHDRKIQGRRVSQQALWNLRFWESEDRVNLGPCWFDGDKVGMRVSEVEMVPYSGKVYNLQVSGSGTFVVEHFAVHNSQYLLNPIPKDSQRFKEEWFVKVDQLPSIHEMDVCITVDPAKSLKDTADRTAITVYGYDRANYMYLLDGLNERLTPDELPEALFEIVSRYQYECKRFYPVGFEAVGFQEIYIYNLERMMLERNHFFPIEPIRRRQSSKEERILRLVPRIKNGFMVPRTLVKQPYTERETEYDLTRRLIWELTRFPFSEYDDLADATADQLSIVHATKLPGSPTKTVDQKVVDFIHPSIKQDKRTLRGRARPVGAKYNDAVR